MSGSSFNYVCYKVEEWGYLPEADQIEAIEKFLRENGKHDAADEVYKFQLYAETVQRRMRIQSERIATILHDAEWWDSGDTNEETFDKQFKAWQEKHSIPDKD